MHKRKLKLNSLYGQMVSAAEKPLTAFGVGTNKKPSKAMEICAKLVRQVSCARCLHYAECKRSGCPASMLGRYLAELNLKTLIDIENDLRPFCTKGLKLRAFAPDIDELKEGAFAVIRAYSEGSKKKLIFHLNVQGYENAQWLEALIFNAYFRAKGKAKRK